MKRKMRLESIKNRQRVDGPHPMNDYRLVREERQDNAADMFVFWITTGALLSCLAILYFITHSNLKGS